MQLESYKFKEACVKEVNEDTLLVEPHGNCVFFNEIFEDDDVHVGNISIVREHGDRETLIKVNAEYIGE